LSLTKGIFVAIVGSGFLAFLWLAVKAAKMKLIIEFENGIACNYLEQDRALNSKGQPPPQNLTPTIPLFFWFAAPNRLFSARCIATFRAFASQRCSILRLGCRMARRKETTIERIYREVTGNKMPAAVKRILLPKRKTHAKHSKDQS
jgi:hypothetical protein